MPVLAKDEVLAIDGKTSRRSGKAEATPLPLVSAFAAQAGLVLGRRATAVESNEKTAIRELPVTLALEDCIVTLDAMGTRPEIAQTIRDRDAKTPTLSCRSRTISPRWPNRSAISSAPSRRRQARPRISFMQWSRRSLAGWKSGAARSSLCSIACTPPNASQTSSRSR